MKKMLCSLLVCCFVLFNCKTAFCQNPVTINNITVERDGNFVHIFYDILEKQKDQIYSITIYVSIDNAAKIRIRNVSGDIGEDVKGGKNRYKATWDVFKQVKQMNSAKFFVEGLLVGTESISSNELTFEDQPIKSNKNLQRKRRWLIAADATDFGWGARIGFMKKWGGYVSLNGYEFASKISAGLTHVITQNQNISFDYYFGGAYIEEYSYSSSYDFETFGLEGGVMFEFYGVTLSGGTIVNFHNNDFGLGLGLGYKF